jgi:hypothetical protein
MERKTIIVTMTTVQPKSIIHLAPCSQEIIDNENPILIRFFFGRCEMRLFGCHGNNNCFSFHGNHGHYLNFHCYQFKI